MLEKLYFDNVEDGKYSAMIDPRKGEISFSIPCRSFLDDIEEVISTGRGVGSIEGVKDYNRYVKISYYLVAPTFLKVVSDLLGLVYCGIHDGTSCYYSVPEDLDIDMFTDRISYGGVVNYLLSADENTLEVIGVDVDSIKNLTPCPLCEGCHNGFKDKYSGVKARILFMESNYGNKDNWLYVGKEPPIRISYCPICGRKLPEEV